MSPTTIEVGRFEHDGRVLVGIRRGEEVTVASEQDDLPRVLGDLPAAAARPARTVALGQLKWLPPLDPAARVFAVAVNYPAHGTETKSTPPPRPLIFYKAPTNFIGQGGQLNANRHISSKFDYEGEVAVVIGRRCSRLAPQDALEVVAGICALDDGSARDLTVMQAGDKPWIDWLAAKGLDGASALGPTVLCGPSVVQALREGSITVSTRLNGETVQHAAMKEMIFSTAQILSTLSSYMTLLPGDVIATGTPSGVGMARNRFLQSGDRLEIEVSGLDPLRLTVG
ncbi:MAG TPA: fumarylacetoacetate hydrolase family protein [Ramlibacter sp.]|nr:fumarylacetoacetate hydrolase family protein [Ramlibacter sp.]